MQPKTKLSGGRVNYYLVSVDHPQREDQRSYQAECEDIIEALELNPDEANIFKEIWRSANARKQNGKMGHTAFYGAEKIVHYAGRILRRLKRQDNAAQDNTKAGTPQSVGTALTDEDIQIALQVHQPTPPTYLTAEAKALWPSH